MAIKNINKSNNKINKIGIHYMFLSIIYRYAIKNKKKPITEFSSKPIIDPVSIPIFIYKPLFEPVIKKKKEIDSIAKWKVGWNSFRTKLSNKEMKTLRKKLERLIKKNIGNGDGDDGDKFLKILKKIVERFKDAIFYTASNKNTILIIIGLISSSIYAYINRKAIGKSISDLSREIEKKCSDFERYLKNKYFDN